MFMRRGRALALIALVAGCDPSFTIRGTVTIPDALLATAMHKPLVIVAHVTPDGPASGIVIDSATVDGARRSFDRTYLGKCREGTVTARVDSTDLIVTTPTMSCRSLGDLHLTLGPNASP
jgi:hypothetical protein